MYRLLAFVAIAIAVIIAGLQGPIYRLLDEKIVSRLQSPPKSDFGLVQIPLAVAYDSNWASPYNLDIVFVHGLGSNPDTTWKNTKDLLPKGSANTINETRLIEDIDWISHLLPEDLPREILPSMRFFYFNFDSYWYRDALTVCLDDLSSKLLLEIHAKTQTLDEDLPRRILFVAYSYGGLVVKQALLNAAANERYVPIADATAGVLFLGTPHKGTSLSRLAWVVAMILRSFGSNPYILEDLHYGSPPLRHLHDKFMETYGSRLSIVNFYEERRTRLLQSGLILWETYVVNKTSATFESITTRNIGIAVDHKGLNKFARRSTEYRLLARELFRLVQDDKKTHRFRTYNIIPKVETPTFIERATLSASMKSQIQEFDGSRQPPACVVLYGLRGSGKTQLALNYAKQFAQRHSHVFWIDASSMDAVFRSYRSIAEEVGFLPIGMDQDARSPVDPSYFIKVVHEWLEEQDGFLAQWLVVIDDLNEAEQPTGYHALVPSGKRGTVLITSHSRLENSMASMHIPKTCNRLQVGSFEMSEAISLLITATEFSPFTAPKSVLDVAADIANLLGRHPLAIGVAAAYARQLAALGVDVEQGVLKQTLSDLSNHRSTLLSDARYEHLTPYQRTLQSTIQNSLDAVKAQNPGSLHLLSLFAEFHRENIVFDIFRLASDVFKAVPSNPVFESLFGRLPLDLQQYLHTSSTGEWDSFAFRRDLEPLLRYSLIEPIASAAGPGVRLHGLIQWYVRQLNQDPRTIVHAKYILAAAIRKSMASRSKTGQIGQYLVLHVKETDATIFERLNSNEPPSEYILFKCYLVFDDAQLFFREGLLDEATSAYNFGWYAFTRRMKDMAHETSPSDWIAETFPLVFQAVAVYQAQSNWSTAEGLLQSAQHILSGPLTQFVESNNAWQVEILLTLADIYIGQAKYAEANETLSQLEDKDMDNRQRLRAFHTLILLNQNQGRWFEAAGLYEEMEAAFPESELSPDSVLVRMILRAYQLSQLGELNEAEVLARQALKMSKEMFGNRARETLSAMGALSHILESNGHCDEAILLQEEILSAKSLIHGPHSPHTQKRRLKLIALYASCDQDPDAEEKLEQVQAFMEDTIGADHPDTINGMMSLAAHRHHAGRWEEAEQLTLEAVERSTAVHGPDHPLTLDRLTFLGIVCLSLDKTEQANAIFEMLSEKSVDQFDVSIGKSGSLRQFLGRLLVAENWKKGELRAALKTGMGVLAIQLGEYGPAHSETLKTYLVLSVLLIEEGLYDVGMLGLHMTKALAMEVLGPLHQVTHSSIKELARFYLSRRDFALTYAQEEELLNIRLKYLGGDHPDTIQSMADAAWVLGKMGFWQLAAGLMEKVVAFRRQRSQEDYLYVLTLLDLGLAYMMQELWDEAEASLLEVVYSAVRKIADRSIAQLGNVAVQYLRQIPSDAQKQTSFNLDQLTESFPLNAEEKAAVKRYLKQVVEKGGQLDDLAGAISEIDNLD